jgi:acyl carrier protein phosphodiesterase
MNFLGHLFLTQDEEALAIGNFIADFLHNRDLAALDEGVRQGVRLHREIDTFTDAHPVVREALTLLRPRHGKYAGVVWDVLSDTLLVDSWQEFGTMPLPAFTDTFYRICHRHWSLIPEKLQPGIKRMIDDDFLAKIYGHQGIEFTLSRLQKRASMPHLLEGGADSLHSHYEDLLLGFRDFYPDIILRVTNLRNEMK